MTRRVHYGYVTFANTDSMETIELEMQFMLEQYNSRGYVFTYGKPQKEHSAEYATTFYEVPVKFVYVGKRRVRDTKMHQRIVSLLESISKLYLMSKK